MNKVDIIIIAATLCFAGKACATPYTCDPSALTYEASKCSKADDVFSLYQDAVDPSPPGLTLKDKDTLPQSLEKKFNKLDLSRKTRKNEQDSLHISTQKIQEGPKSQNKGMQSQLDKSKKTQLKSTPGKQDSKNKNLYVGVKVPLNTNNKKKS